MFQLDNRKYPAVTSG